MAKKPWGGAGAWAAESELADAQLEQLDQHPHHPQQASSIFSTGDTAFPSLGEAAHTKAAKKKKQTVSLAKFIAGGTASFSEAKGLTTEEKMALPTGPRDRSSEEDSFGGLGGGFKDYGGYRGEGRDRDYGRDRDGGFGGRRSDREGGFSRGGFAGDRDVPEGPSRADIANDWGATKKVAPPSRNRFDDRDFPSKADDDSHWGSTKKFVPAPAANGGSRRVSKYDFSSSRNGAPNDSSSDSDSWAASKKGVPTSAYDSFGQRDRDFWNSKEKGGVDSNSWGRRDADPGRKDGDRGSEVPTERPRLVLQPRSQRLDSAPLPPKEDMENEPPTSEPSIGQPSKSQRVNPFGEAKPREVILEEKGMNWKKLDQELEQKVSERADGTELALKEEIKVLQDSLKLAETEADKDAEGVVELREQLAKKEEELNQLKATSSDKGIGAWGVGDRFGNKKESNAWSRQPSNSNGRSYEKGGGRW